MVPRDGSTPSIVAPRTETVQFRDGPASTLRSVPDGRGSTHVEIETFVTPGLGDNTFLVGQGDEAVLVDPQRDAGRFLDEAERRGWRVRHVLETHVHNDYVSGALEVRQRHGAEIHVAASAGPFTFPHVPAEAGDEVEIAGLRFVVRPAPGHTFDHIAWDLRIDGAAGPDAVFSGGSLLVGSAGRTDLLGAHLAEELARLQFRTVRELASLPPGVRLLPTHGAGSLCLANVPSSDARTSTIGAELATSAALRAADEMAFVRQQLAAHGPYPAYYRWVATINRAGAPLLRREPDVAVLSPAAAERSILGGAAVVDGRGREAFAAAHVPGSINIEIDDRFGTWVGWLIPFGTPLVLVLPDPGGEAAAEACLQLLRIGWDDIAGRLDGGIDAWSASGRTVRAYPVATMQELHDRVLRGEPIVVLDVRTPAEWRDDGLLPGSTPLFVGDLPGRLDELDRDREHWVVCASGQRAASASSLLDGAGVPVRLVARDGAVGWVERITAAGARPLRQA
jgi:glyoxylase-like metal-dependent hydrolase (beta-lactamase superfamily II)/rhodanese-related sulfurtransferase